jgi:uncharacterized repeat protein (TIGR03803 family)
MRARSIVVLTLLFLSISSAQAATQKVLYTFTGGLDGSQPYQAGVIFDPAGNLYGVTQYGGAYNQGTVFQLTPSPSGPWTETVLYSFMGVPDGEQPQGGLVIDGAGNLYGTTSFGGDPNSGCGTVFELSPSESGWTFTVLHAFAGGKDGCSPQADLSLYGDIYGTTAGGGSGSQGTVFVLSTSGGNDSVGSFAKNTGMYPGGLGLFTSGGAVRAIYGTTYLGGKQQKGNIFELTWGNHIVAKHVFNTTNKAGYWPIGDLLTQINAGEVWMMYGTTSRGGGGGRGAVYRLTESQASYDVWELSVLHVFSGSDGDSPWAGVVLDAAGNLYGTTQWGGPEGSNAGTVFKLTPGAKKKWTQTVLYSFTGGADGSVPTSGVVLDNAGNLYGTTVSGGAYNQGVVYEVTP